VPDLIDAGGGRAVLAHPGADSQRIEPDAIRTCDAEVVVVAPCGYHLEPAARLAEQVVAAGWLPPAAEVWAVDADAYFVRPGPRLVDGAAVVASILHPELAGPPDPTQARRIAAESR
jgi:iron complex transport system substrate-binding protein